jgi:hypothetical protein
MSLAIDPTMQAYMAKLMGQTEAEPSWTVEVHKLIDCDDMAITAGK